MVSNFEQFANAIRPIAVTELGIVTEVRLEQLLYLSLIHI